MKNVQATFGDIEFQASPRKTRRAAFLEQMDSVAPWADLVALVEPHRPRGGGRGRQPWPTETLLRMYMVQCWFNLSDEATEDALWDSRAVRAFVGCGEGVPDATTLLRFRRLLEENSLQEAMLSLVNARLDRAGLLMRGGSIVDASIVEAPSSTKNARGERDPEMHQTKKGGQYYFGMKVHAAVDAGTGYAVAASFTPANVHDICELHGLVREGDTVVFADSGYRGCAKRPEIASDPRLSAVDWRICAAPSRKRALRGADREEERRTSSVRVHVEHLFALVKRTFGYSKARYRGIAKNAARIWALLASANLLYCARAGRQGEFRAA